MSVFPPDTLDNHEAHAKEWREKWGVPFGRAGNARDYAQCIIGMVTNAYQTGSHVVMDGGWLLEQGECCRKCLRLSDPMGSHRGPNGGT